VTPSPPRPAKRPTSRTWFGRAFEDEYAWLRNPDWFDRLRTPELLEPEIRAHLDAENAYAEAILSGVEPLRTRMVDEILARAGRLAEAPPWRQGEYDYWTELEPGAQHPRFLRRRGPDRPVELLLDAEVEARGKPYYRLSEFTSPCVSPDQRWFAWGADEAGDQHFRLHVRDLSTGLVAAVIEHGYGGFAFSPDSRFLYWVFRDELSRPTRLFRRPVSGGPDELIYEEADPAFFMHVTPGTDREVQLKVHNHDADETWLVSEGPAIRRLAPRTDGVHYDVEAWGADLVIRTNADGAFDFKLMLADPAAPERANWREWLPHRPGRFVAEVRAYGDHLVRIEWRDANPRLVICDRAGREIEPEFPDEAWSLRLMGPGGAPGTARCLYQSPRMPPQWIDFDLASGAQVAVTSSRPEGFDPAAYEVRRLEAPAADGELIPITLLRAAGAADPRPLYMYGYGSYGYSVEPVFSPAHLALVDQGMNVAIAHIRGGGERGPRWFDQAHSVRKKTSVTDFIACADHLVAVGVTEAGRIVGHSLSAGGIVIGGAANLRPELWAGLINQVPFVDVLNSLHDETNPLIPGAYAVWGDPSDRAVFDYVASYSPYDNIAAQPYPAVLAYGGLLDNRVGYWEPAKWVARLRDRTTGDRPALLRIDMTAGHQGHAGLGAEAERAALFNTFALWAVGLAP
jgi:oligopeptidase B